MTTTQSKPNTVKSVNEIPANATGITAYMPDNRGNAVKGGIGWCSNSGLNRARVAAFASSNSNAVIRFSTTMGFSSL